MVNEVLNIDYHRRRLLVKALRQYRYKQAAEKLGISRRCVCRWIRAYAVRPSELNGSKN